MTAGRARYFGDAYDVPAYDHAVQVPTPTGTCYHCEESIQPDDDGWARPCHTETAQWGVVYIHRECDLHLTTGHLMGVCPCTGWGERSARDQARETLRRANQVLGGTGGRQL